MKILIAGGSGFVGQYLTRALQQRCDMVTILGRDKDKIKKIYQNKVNVLTWQEFDSHRLSDYNVIINLAGENIGQKKWTASVKQTILESRINTTQTLAQACAALGENSPRILSASAVGIYGISGDYVDQPIPVDESWPVPENYTPNFLSEVAQQWEKALMPAIEKKIAVTIMRFGVVIKATDGMLKKLLPSVKFGLAAKLGQGQQWLSWIGIDDLVAAIIFLLDHPQILGAINLTHPVPVTQNEFIHQLAQHYHRPCCLTLPRGLIHFLFGQMGQELLLGGQKVVPMRLQNYHFTFSQGSIADAFS